MNKKISATVKRRKDATVTVGWIEEAKKGNITHVKAWVNPLVSWNVSDLTLPELAKSAYCNDQTIVGIDAI